MEFLLFLSISPLLCLAKESYTVVVFTAASWSPAVGTLWGTVYICADDFFLSILDFDVPASFVAVGDITKELAFFSPLLMTLALCCLI